LFQRCEGKGGGAGVAKGDFNGDGVADLAVGSPFENVSNVPGAGAVHVLYGSTTGLTAAGDQLWSEANISSGRGPEASDLFGLALASGDFDGDGFSDIAIGVPRQDWVGLKGVVDADSGAVHVLYGSSSGLGTARRQYFSHGGSDRSGEALVWGDFNGDGYGDLAVGEPRDEGLFASDSGSVTVYYGSSSGLQEFAGEQFVEQGTSPSDSRFIPAGDSPESDDHFGAVLSAGDIDGDGYQDLVVGVPDEDETLLTPDAGMIHVVFGSPTGLRNAQALRQSSMNVSGSPEDYDRMGWALAVGDFNNDGFADVAVGVPFEDIGENVDAGAVQTFPGSADGLSGDFDRFWDQSDFGEAPEDHDLFGWAVAAGKFNSGNFVDLAIGVPGEDFGGTQDVGLVQVAYGSNLGIQTTVAAESWYLGLGNITEPIAAGDKFGYALTAWNFGNGDRADLVIGIPYREVTLSSGTVRNDAGALLVLYGHNSGLGTSDYQYWTLESFGLQGSAQTLGRFGYSLY
jgi:hypothetical protein